MKYKYLLIFTLSILLSANSFSQSPNLYNDKNFKTKCEGKCKNGNGKMTFTSNEDPNKSIIYEGTFVDKKLHGNGTYQVFNRTVNSKIPIMSITGNFKNGLPQKGATITVQSNDVNIDGKLDGNSEDMNSFFIAGKTIFMNQSSFKNYGIDSISGIFRIGDINFFERGLFFMIYNTTYVYLQGKYILTCSKPFSVNAREIEGTIKIPCTGETENKVIYNCTKKVFETFNAITTIDYPDGSSYYGGVNIDCQRDFHNYYLPGVTTYPDGSKIKQFFANDQLIREERTITTNEGGKITAWFTKDNTYYDGEAKLVNADSSIVYLNYLNGVLTSSETEIERKAKEEAQKQKREMAEAEKQKMQIEEAKKQKTQTIQKTTKNSTAIYCVTYILSKKSYGFGSVSTSYAAIFVQVTDETGMANSTKIKNEADRIKNQQINSNGYMVIEEFFDNKECSTCRYYLKELGFEFSDTRTEYTTIR
jgi:hypothetical protein